MHMKKVGITGGGGFVGSHLFNSLGLFPEDFQLVPFRKEFFDSEECLDEFVTSCDVIVHLAALNRHESQEVIYRKNVQLTKKLADSLLRTNSKAHVLFSSSVQEERNNLYGKSKKESREILADWADKSGGKFTGLIIPNVFGPFCKPNYNSFIATFCYKLTHGEVPSIDHDGHVKLIYVSELVSEIIAKIRLSKSEYEYIVPHTSEVKVSEVLSMLENYTSIYYEKGEIPFLENDFDLNLFNTYRSYIKLASYFPVQLNLFKDVRGGFAEIIRLGTGGQCSFSTTVPGVTRGNHFHTRKIERFAVIRGRALIQLRKIDSKEVLEFYLDGEEPSYVDMPIWYTHNIKNIGNEDLYTLFWINEPYDPSNADTYFIEV